MYATAKMSRQVTATADACIRQVALLDANAPASPENRRFFGLLPERLHTCVNLHKRRIPQ